MLQHLKEMLQYFWQYILPLKNAKEIMLHEFWHHIFNKTQWTLASPPPQALIDRPLI